jgi:hypothetical protein
MIIGDVQDEKEKRSLCEKEFVGDVKNVLYAKIPNAQSDL